MKTTVTRETFIKAFEDYNRADNFSWIGLNALYDYFTELEKDLDEEIDFNVIEICCNYTEDTIEQTLENYNVKSIDDLENKTTIIYKDDENVLFLNF